MNNWWTLMQIEEYRRREMLNEIERRRISQGRKALRPAGLRIPVAAYLAAGILAIMLLWLAAPANSYTGAVAPVVPHERAPASNALMEPVVLQFTSLGLVSLTGQGQTTTFAFDMAGLEPGTLHGVLVREGKCSQGEVQDFSDLQFGVTTLQANDAGLARAEAALDVSLGALMNGNRKITVGMLAGRSRGADCVDIPSM